MAYINKAELVENLDRFATEHLTPLIRTLIEKQPIADVVGVKHGHFVRNERNIPKMKEFHEKGFALSMNTKSIFWTCSCCGSWASLTQKYCSECGAKMDGERRDT